MTKDNSIQIDHKISAPKSNVIPFTDKARVSFNSAFDGFTMSALHRALEHAKYYLSQIQNEIYQRKHVNRKASRIKSKSISRGEL